MLFLTAEKRTIMGGRGGGGKTYLGNALFKTFFCMYAFPKTWLKFLIGKGGYPSPLADRNQKFDGLKCWVFWPLVKTALRPGRNLKGRKIVVIHFSWKTAENISNSALRERCKNPKKKSKSIFP